MSYTKTEWKTGDIITAEKMNKLEEGVSQLSEENVDRGTSLWAIVKKTAFVEALTDEELTKFKTAWGITDSEEEPDTPVEPDEPEVTLTSISATYAGGDVAVGTALTDLTGITVTAHYSDGSTANVTGYTLSGTIAEGSNTITVSYSGKTTTFTVTGVAESSGGDDTTTLKGIQIPPTVPSNFKSTEDWKYSGNSGNLCEVIGAAKYLYLDRVFTGTVYIRSMTSSPFMVISMGMALVAEDYITNQTAEGEILTETQTWSKFDDGYLRVSSDGSEYKFSSDYPSDGMKYVRLAKYDIPEGQHAVLFAANAGTGNGNTLNIDGGWMTVFFEDPTGNITCTEVTE